MAAILLRIRFAILCWLMVILAYLHPPAWLALTQTMHKTDKYISILQAVVRVDLYIQAQPFESTGKLEYENGPWHDNICVGQYGVQTLRPWRDIMKQTGSSDGWFADWLCKKFDWFVKRPWSMSDCHGSCSDTDNGNREYY